MSKSPVPRSHGQHLNFSHSVLLWTQLKSCEVGARITVRNHTPPANNFACDHAIKSQQITTFGRWERQSRCKSQHFPGKVTTWAPRIMKEITAPGGWESWLCLAHLRLCPGLEPSFVPAVHRLVLAVTLVMTSRACMRCLRRGNVVSCTSFFSLFSSGWMKFVQLENEWLNGIILDRNYVPQIKKLTTYSSNVVSYIASFHYSPQAWGNLCSLRTNDWMVSYWTETTHLRSRN